MDPDYRCVASFHRSRRILREPGRELLFFRESFRVDFVQRQKLVRIYITICIYLSHPFRAAAALWRLLPFCSSEREGGYVDSEWRRAASNGAQFVRGACAEGERVVRLPVSPRPLGLARAINEGQLHRRLIGSCQKQKKATI
jgi:hypothetical protein